MLMRAIGGTQLGGLNWKEFRSNLNNYLVIRTVCRRAFQNEVDGATAVEDNSSSRLNSVTQGEEAFTTNFPFLLDTNKRKQ